MNNKTDAEVGDYKSREMTGKEFCTFFPNLSKRLVKLTNETENHNGFQFVTGLNVDSNPFNPTGECEPGGIYFTDIGNIAKWLAYGLDNMKYCRTVTLPPDCRVFVEGDKFKADKMILGERVEIKDLPYWSDNDYCKNAAKQNVESLKYIRDINHDIQMEAVKNNRHAIDYLFENKINASEEVQIKAVNEDYRALGNILRYKVDISEKVKMEAVKRHWTAIEYLLEKKINVSVEVQIEAIKQDFRVINLLLKYEVDISKEVKLEAIKQDYRIIKYLLHKKVKIPEEIQFETINLALASH
jgi:hypothetical protein